MTKEQYEHQIIKAKRSLRERIPDFKVRLAEETERLQRRIAKVKEDHAAGQAIEDIDFKDVAAGNVSSETRDRIHRSGALVVRNVFDADTVNAWNESLMEYVSANNYFEKQVEKAGLDQYFGALSSNKPQIFGLYWSKAQMEARQSPQLAELRRWLNGLWHHPDSNNPEFDASQECLYADRLRQREPGDTSLGLSPHIDGGSIERWIEPSFQEVYKDVFFGDLENFDPFNAHFRTQTREIPSPAVCRMFRTFQGWTALTPQGPGDGTLNLVPISRAIAWLLLRALDDDQLETELCGARAGRALAISKEYHEMLLDAYVPIPKVYAGDTVWWHPDLIHGVEDQNKGAGYSNVMYIGSAPDCEKNREFLDMLRPAFEAGKSSPDFAPEDYEVDFKGRFKKEDLSEIGLRQLGYTE
jgi:ectoine hydroxylase-related dioxygenase (phytanoyl-CoA dioxygenase family)